MGEVDLDDSEAVKKGAQEWVEYPRKRVEELMVKAREEGKDPNQIALGYLVNTIIGDDAGMFQAVIFRGFGLELSQEVRDKIIQRLDWEIGLEQAPQEVRNQLKVVREELGQDSWDTKKDFDESYKFWKENAQKWLIDFIESHPEVKKAYEEYLALEGLMREKGSPAKQSG